MNDLLKSQLRIVSFLLVSGGLGYLSATYIANDPALTAVFAPAINYILYVVNKELKSEGFIEAIKSKNA
jgi:hypothetical protein